MRLARWLFPPDWAHRDAAVRLRAALGEVRRESDDDRLQRLLHTGCTGCAAGDAAQRARFARAFAPLRERAQRT